MKILIYAESLSERLKYLVEIVLNEITQYSFELTHDQETFINSDSTKINYSTKSIPHSLQIIPAEFLFSNDIIPVNLNYFELENVIAFEQDLIIKNPYIYSHDLFAVVFFIITRYEEYLTFKPDTHGRFTSKQSVLYKYNLHKIPYIDIQLNRLFEYMRNLDLNFKIIQPKKTTKALTIDIDHIYKYKGKSLIWLNLKAAKNLLFFNKNELQNLYNYIVKKQSDTFDSYEYIQSFVKANNINLYVFYLLSDKGKFDQNNLNIDLITHIYSSFNNIAVQGIHPSYQSNDELGLLKNEIHFFKKIANIYPEISRQHFLKLSFPQTYHNLIDNQIFHDFSMGWSDSIGFRAGTSHSFSWFDLVNNKSSQLKITPFCAMDVTLKNYMQLSTNDAIIELEEILKLIEINGGQFVSLWHNESLGTENEWKGWRAVMEELYK